MLERIAQATTKFKSKVNSLQLYLLSLVVLYGGISFLLLPTASAGPALLPIFPGRLGQAVLVAIFGAAAIACGAALSESGSKADGPWTRGSQFYGLALAIVVALMCVSASWFNHHDLWTLALTWSWIAFIQARALNFQHEQDLFRLETIERAIRQVRAELLKERAEDEEGNE